MGNQGIKLRVTVVSPEIYPYSDQGSISKATLFFSNALLSKGHQVIVFVPRFGYIGKRKFSLCSELRRIRVRMGTSSKEFNLFSAVAGSPVQISEDPGGSLVVYFVDKELFFSQWVHDAARGFSFPAEADDYFSRAVLESLKVLDLTPDVIHCLGGVAASIPDLLSGELFNQAFFSGVLSEVIPEFNRDFSGYLDPENPIWQELVAVFEHRYSARNPQGSQASISYAAAAETGN